MNEGNFNIEGIPAGLLSSGVGYVIIPEEIDPDIYIENCYRTNTISMFGGIGYSNFFNVPVDEEIMQRVKFPKVLGQYGSAVIWINIPKHEKPVIIGTLKYVDDLYSIENNQKRITKSFGDNSIDVSMKALSSTIDVNVLADLNTEAKVNLNIKNPKKNCKLNVFVSGDIILHSTGKNILVSDDLIQLSVVDENGNINGILKYKLGEGLTYKDAFKNVFIANKDNVSFKSGGEKINLQGGKEPIALADSLGELLKSFITKVSQATVIVNGSPKPLVNALDIASLLSEIEGIKSKVSSTD